MVKNEARLLPNGRPVARGAQGKSMGDQISVQEPARAPDLTHGIRLNLLVHYIPLAGVGL